MKWSLIMLLSVYAATGKAAQGGSEPPIVFIPGIKGSVLADNGAAVKWITPLQALGLASPNLSLPLDWKDGKQGQDGLSPRAVLSGVRILPWFLEQQVYGPLLKAAGNTKRPFFAFPYDWRRDNNETLAKFENFVEWVRQKNQGARIRVIAHSMGGLITLALLNKRPELFDSVVFVGVPFSGTITFLLDMHAGTATGLNRAILSPEVLFTHPSIYTLFPVEGSGLVDAAGKPIQVDFYSPEDWKKHGLGIFYDSSAVTPQQKNYLTVALQRAKAFRQLLVPRDQRYPPITIVSGREIPTLASVMQNGPHSINGWDFDAQPKEPGDGRVLVKQSFPPAGIPYRVVYSKADHADQLSDPVVLTLIQK